MPAFSNPKVANHIIFPVCSAFRLHHAILRLPMPIYSTGRQDMLDKPELRPPRPKSPLVPALLPYERHSVGSFPRSLRSNSQKRADQHYVWRTVTHSREGGGGADEERDKSKLHLWGLGIGLLSSRMGMYRERSRWRGAREAGQIQHVTAPTCSKSARSWLDRFNNATHVCKL